MGVIPVCFIFTPIQNKNQKSKEKSLTCFLGRHADAASMRQQMPDQYKSQRISNLPLSEPKARGRSSAAAAVPAGEIIHHP